MKLSLLILLAFILPGLNGCSLKSVPAQPAQQIVWPSPPLEARVRYLGEIRKPADAGIQKSWWKKLRDTVFGENEVPLIRPYGILADGLGRIIIVDTGGRCLHVLDRRGNRHLIITGQEQLLLLSPIAAAEDENGRILVTDSAAGKVYAVNLERNTLSEFTGAVKRPTGIAYNPTNRLVYVTDTIAAQIVAFDREGREKLRFGAQGAEQGKFNHPTDLFITRNGTIYVTDALNARVQVFSSEGSPFGGFGEAGDSSGHFAKPKGIALDSEEHVYVADALFDGVQIFDREGHLLLTFGNSGSAPGEFWIPSGISIDGSDTIYIADSYNQRIQVFQYLRHSEVAR